MKKPVVIKALLLHWIWEAPIRVVAEPERRSFPVPPPSYPACFALPVAARLGVAILYGAVWSVTASHRSFSVPP